MKQATMTNVTGSHARWAVATVLLLACLGCLPLSHLVGSRVSSGGYLNNASESARAERLLERDFSTGSSQFQLELRADEPASEPRIAAAGRRLVADAAASNGVLYARSWWNTGDSRLRSPDGRTTLVVMRLQGSDAEAERRARQLTKRFAGEHPPFRIAATGRAAVNADLAERSRKELIRTELISLPLLAIVLYLALGSVVAAAIPLGVGVVCITGTQAVLYGLTHVMQVSVFAPNLVTALALGLSIDYSIIMISRFREERGAGLDAHAASQVVRKTSGRTVMCSAATVAVSLSALLTVPLPFLRSLGAASVTVVVLASLTAWVAVPIVLTVLGHHLEWGRLRRRRAIGRRRSPQETVIRGVLRHPVKVLVTSSALLLLLALPFLRVQWGLIDERWLPAQAPIRTVTEHARQDLPLATGASPLVLLPSTPRGSAEAAHLAADLSRAQHVVSVSGPDGVFVNGKKGGPPRNRTAAQDLPAAAKQIHGTWLSVVTRLDPSSVKAQQLVQDIRARADVPTIMVTGETAVLVDILSTLHEAALRSAVIICLATGLLLIFFTRSLFIPAKALMTNLLSMTAGFGAMVFLFQDGHLAQWLGGTATGATDPLLPMLMFCIVFGVSMDYEIFIVARIREEHLAGTDNCQSIAAGLRRTGPVVTGCSLALVAAVAPLMASSVTVTQLLGTVLVISVLVDATVVRCLLVPSAMALAGRMNWWLPFTPGRPRSGEADSTRPTVPQPLPGTGKLTAHDSRK
ncbi:MMPL family transporter [Streptomyces erythrochromogenes]|uniref:MMPL family transporter n=1 Tax=Streptomyces erythrochromogenes TaxID=285574 RepID=UPI00131E3D76|nr:MMPL family transporter [Streptomyces erythrochromogenes]MCX5583165.1 MMPL family transporter [Streptomyces erythrochromogenes]